MTKVIAFFLPQFHHVIENDEWWGENFTEWTVIKRSRPLFKNHKQPRKPMFDRYYDLLERKTVEWQTELATNHGIDGFAYYHYWFLGDLLLEKPAENLLHWKDIKQNFFFFWANHTWYKSIDGKKSILKEQQYGQIDDWRKHYEYLRQFFFDSRYMKIDNKPVFGVYVPSDIPKYDMMIKNWNEWCIDDGFDGIYIINSYMPSSNSGKKSEIISTDNYVLYRQPNIAMDFLRKKHLIKRVKSKLSRILHIPYLMHFKYKEIADEEKNIVNTISNTQRNNAIFCLSSGWDNTPRHGLRGSVVEDFSPEIFQDVFFELYKESIVNKKDFIFINAWNEWGEGMVLEPDNYFNYRILEAIKKGKELL